MVPVSVVSSMIVSVKEFFLEPVTVLFYNISEQFLHLRSTHLEVKVTIGEFSQLTLINIYQTQLFILKLQKNKLRLMSEPKSHLTFKL